MEQNNGQRPVRLIFVCLGNICRSPTAEAIMADQIERADLTNLIEVDSAGTGDWHIGDAPDPRAIAEAASRGITMSSLARQIQSEDFEKFDLILAMDSANLRDLRELAPDDRSRDKIHLLRHFDPSIKGLDLDFDATDVLDIPDPYFGGPEGFSHVFDLIDVASSGLLDHVRSQHLGNR